MIFKQIQHGYDFHAIQNYHMSIYRRSIEKEQRNPYLKWRDQMEKIKAKNQSAPNRQTFRLKMKPSTHSTFLTRDLV